MDRRKNRREAFTLIELLVVLAIIATLAAIIAPSFLRHEAKSKITAAKAEMHTLGLALTMFRQDVGRYPTTEEGLEALIEASSDAEEKWLGPYLDTAKVDFDMDDPWENPYLYVCPGKHNTEGYDLISYGADKVEGGEDENEDIVNWRTEE